jgi:predicted ATPase
VAICECRAKHVPRRIVLTGGPGAGKTAVLELIHHSFCRHVKVLPEAASIVFGGGFPREDDDGCRRAVQRAIFHVQRELENVADVHAPAIVLCDRGTVDGLAYWPGTAADFFSTTHTTSATELARYDAVVHLRTPSASNGYNHANPLRTETAEAAAAIDARIVDAWAAHPNRFMVPSTPDFFEKARQVVDILRRFMPECCATHVVSEGERPLLSGSPLRGL